MKAAAGISLLLVIALLGACRHRGPKEAKANAPATESVPESGKCQVKGFAYSMPAPGPIADAGAP